MTKLLPLVPCKQKCAKFILLLFTIHFIFLHLLSCLSLKDPIMAEVSFIHFPDEEHDDGVEEIVTLDSLWSHIYGSDSDSLSPHSSQPFAVEGEISDQTSGNRKNQVNFVMNLFHQRVEQSNLTSGHETVSEPIHEPNLGVIEENCELGVNYSRVQLDLGLGNGIVLDGDSDDDDDVDGGDEFFVARRGSETCNPGSSLGFSGVRVVEINSDSGSDVEEVNGLYLHLEEEDYAVDNLDDEDISLPICWDMFHLEDRGEPNNDFGWEEVYAARVDEREVLSFVDDPDDEGSISVIPMAGSVEENVGRGGDLGSFEWEVLMNVDNLGRNPELESDPGPYFRGYDDYSITTEYEMMFGPLADGENPLLARPPASKSVIKKLSSVVITEEDVLNEKALCAVCKDQIEVNGEVKQLPCSHWYHGDCILPWLGIRNTCPVCRYELPTDDPDYEHRRTRRSAHLL